jgi:hypothetical protein
MFNLLEDDECIVIENGIEKPAKLYERRGALYVGIKGGFARLKANGSTSHPQTKLLELHRDGPLFQDQFGRLRVEGETVKSRRLELGPDGMPSAIEDQAGGMRKLPGS